MAERSASSLVTSLAAVLLASLTACSAPEANQTTPSGTQPKPGVVPPPVKVPNLAECGTPLTPGPTIVRRLTNEEYLRSARDIFKLTSAEVAELEPMLKDDGIGIGNVAEGLKLSEDHLRRYLDVSAKVADFALSTPERRAAFVSCDLTVWECRKEFAFALGSRMFRSAIPEERVWDLEALSKHAITSQADPDPYRAAKLMVQGLLTSPRFVFRLEKTNGLAQYGWQALDSWNVAVRLSYMLWGTIADADLHQKAFANALQNGGQVAATTREMLADPRAKEGIGRFLSRWLGVEFIRDTVRSPAAYPLFNDDLKQSMRAETARFVEDFWTAPGLNFFDAFTARYTYMDSALAQVYGMQAPSGQGLVRVDFPADSPRVGFLTHPGVLTAGTTEKELVAPILRGKFIREHFLCTLPIPMVPPVVPSLETTPGLTTRQLLEQHRSNPACEACHKMLDPVGLAFEQFDAVGQFRATGTQGEALTGSGQVFGLPGDPTFTGPGELAALLQQSEATTACLATQLFTYTYGRVPTASDACTVTQAQHAFKTSNFDVQAMITAFTTSDAFRFANFPQTGAQP